MALSVRLEEEAPGPSERDVNKADVDKVRARAKERQAPNEPVEVDLEEEDDEPEPGPSRGDKKANRWREHKERAEAATREATEAKERAANVERQFALQQQQFGLLQQQLGRKDEKDPIEEAIKGVDRDRRSLIDQYNAKAPNQWTAAELTEMRERAEVLERKKLDLVTDASLKRNAPKPQNVQAEVLRGQLVAKYPDIWGGQNPHAQQVMQGIYMAKLQRGGKEGFDLADEAAEETRKALGMKRAQAQPPAGLRERYNGVRAGNAEKTEGPRTITLTPEQQKIARTMYPKGAKGEKLTAAQSYKLWAQKVGSRLKTK